MNKKVMIVDDDRHIRWIVSRLLERSGLDVLEADSGTRCLRELEQGFKGVILMDVMMPGMDGWHTIREIAERGYSEGNLIFMLSALDVPGEEIEGLHGYVTDYVTKPFEPEELVEICTTYLEYLDLEES